MIKEDFAMSVPEETLVKMQSLPSDKMSLVINLVDQLAAMNPIDIFEALREDGKKNPMNEDDVDNFVSDVRKERNAVSG